MLMENKELMMQERFVFEERIEELVYENNIILKEKNSDSQ